MSMFDYIKFKKACFNCGHILSGFQSKDGECLLEILKPTDVKTFYDYCENCGEWNEYKNVNGRIIRVKNSLRGK